MNVRLSTLALSLALGLPLSAYAEFIDVVWTGAGTSPSVADTVNWQGTSPTGQGGENFIFGDINPEAFGSVVFPGLGQGSLAVNDLQFTGLSPLNYMFSGTGDNPALRIFGGLTMNTAGTVTFADTLAIGLNYSGNDVTIAAGGTVTVDGPISGDDGGGAIAKYGAGTLVLGGDSTFGSIAAGKGFTLHEGTLLLGGSSVLDQQSAILTGPLGRGLAKLYAGTTLGVAGPNPYVLHNDVELFTETTGHVAIDLPSGSSLALAGALSGPAGLVKMGGGALSVSSNVFSYSGDITVDAGTLVFDDNFSSLSGITVNGGGALVLKNSPYLGTTATVNSGGLLVGSGTIDQGLIGAGATLSPGFKDSLGDRIGELNFFDLTLGQNSILEIDVQHLGGGEFDFDRVTVSTPTTLTIAADQANPLTLKLISLNSDGLPGGLSTGLTEGTLYSLNFLSYDTTVVGDLELGVNVVLDTSAFGTEASYAIFGLEHSGNNFYLTFTPVPEPSTYLLILSGLVIVGLGYRRRQRQA